MEQKRICIAVTGASGFLGSEIVNQLDRANIAVRAIARAWKGQSPWSTNVERVTGDITDAKSLYTAFLGTTSVIHCAGLAHQFGKMQVDASDFQRVNVHGTESVLKTAADLGIEHTVLISSVSVYGGGEQPTFELSPCAPADAYGASKLESEKVAKSIAEESRMRLTILRMATIFGEGDPGNVGRLMRAIDRGRFVWLGTGQNVKSLIYHEDAARACVLAATSPKCAASNRTSTYNVSVPPVSMLRVVNSLANGLGRETPRWYIPAGIAKVASRTLSAIVRRGSVSKMHRTIKKWLSDDIYVGTRFEEDFRFSPRTTVEEGLCRQAHWYRQHKVA